MAAHAPGAAAQIDLGPFRRRILLLRVWRLAAIGGTVGAGFAVAALLGDRLDYWNAPLRVLTALLAAGIATGAAMALIERTTDVQIAQSVDRRSRLDDRLTTIYEAATSTPSAGTLGYIDAVRADASRRIAHLSARALYPVTVRRAQIIFVAAAALAAALYLALDTTLLLPAAARLDAAAMARQGARVEQIARPLMREAKSPAATPDEKQLAKRLDRFAEDLRRDRTSRQEALLRANALAQQARQLETERAMAASQALSSAQTAGQKLQAMASQASLQKSSAADLAAQASALQQKIAALEQQLSAAKAARSGPNASQQAALQKRIAKLESQLHEIQLSQRALAVFAKLQSLQQFKEAMTLLGRLQAQQQALQNGQSPPMTEAEAKAMAAQLEQLAKQLDSNAKLQAYADALLKAAMQAQLSMQNMRVSEGLLGAFGLQSDEAPQLGPGGRGGTNPGVWAGGVGHLHHFDKSSLLHVKFQDRVITSQIGKNGPSTYTDQVGPAQIGGDPGIPYQNVLPKYEKTAESALSRGHIPPSMRTRVREYFESLHQGD